MSGDKSALDTALAAGFESSASTTEQETQSAPQDEQQAESLPTPPGTATPEPQVAETPAEERQRDASGKFTKPGHAAAAPTAAQATPKPQATQAEAAPAAPTELKPPQNWKASAREEWAKLPRHVQEEAKRTEVEAMRVMRESAQARQFAGAFEKMVTPYRGILQGEPLQVVGGLLQTAAVLNTAPPKQKAELLAQIIDTYGVDIAMLDAALSGKPVEPKAQSQQAARPEQFRDPRVDEWLARQEQEQQREVQRTYAEFAKGAEFLNEPWPGHTRPDGSPVLVRDLVANLLDASTASGIDLPLKDAYAQVISQHPEISRVLRQREEARAVATAQAATQRTRDAASSVRSQPTTRPAARNVGLDSIVDEAFSAARGR